MSTEPSYRQAFAVLQDHADNCDRCRGVTDETPPADIYARCCLVGAELIHTFDKVVDDYFASFTLRDKQ